MTNPTDYRIDGTWKITLTGEPHDDNIEEADDAFTHEITIKGRGPVDAWRNAIEKHPDKFEYGIDVARFDKDGMGAHWERGAPEDEEFYYNITFERVD
jgi:hypothetical protein